MNFIGIEFPITKKKKKYCKSNVQNIFVTCIISNQEVVIREFFINTILGKTSHSMVWGKWGVGNSMVNGDGDNEE